VAAGKTQRERAITKTASLARSCFTPSQLPVPGLPEVAVIGRSNVGKSSLINSVLGQKSLMRVSNTPGRTRAVFFVDLGGRGYLVDLPGYGFAKVPLEMKKEWGRLVEAYLKRKASGPALLLVDARRDPMEGDIQMAGWFRHYGRAFHVVMTKADKLSRGHWKTRADAITRGLDLEADQRPIPFSAVTGEGVKSLRHLIETSME
jgi:GTP-binding protein